MMRTPSKVTMVSSSPGRAEKLPAPVLTRLLRGKGGSRSRGRSSSSLSRSSPMFVARRRSASASSVDVPEEKEPSSPKVTCIGQVRISKRKSSSTSSRSKQQQKQGCRCLHKGFFCNPFSKKVKFRSPLESSPSAPYGHHPPRGWRRWFLLPRSGCYRQRKGHRQRQQQQHLFKEDGPRTLVGAPPAEAGSDYEGEHSEQGDVEEDEEEETKVFVSTTPPKNALLLMRCRSAPHRPASLPNRFWASSPSEAEDDVAVVTASTAPPRHIETSHREDGAEEPVTTVTNDRVATYETWVGVNDAVDESREGEDEDRKAAAVGPSSSFSSRPLILTRCKSEPARRAAKLAAPEASYCFWNSSSSSNQVNNARSKNNKWLTLLGEAEACPVHTQ